MDLGDGNGVIQKNVFVEYNRELFLNDTISIKIVNIEFSKLSFNIKYEIYNESNEKVINGSTLLVCFDYSNRKVKKLPDSFKEKVLKLA